MITGIIIALFIIQLITIFFMILLNSRLSNVKDLEIHQNQLIREMDDAISLYLLEMKEENDRLISELQQTKVNVSVSQVTTPPPFVESDAPSSVQADEKITNDQIGIASSVPEEVVGLEIRQFIPKTKAANAYIKQQTHFADGGSKEELDPNKQQPIEEEIVEKMIQQELTYEEQVISYYKEGMSVEAIAKTMQRGKTEIELLIKFHA